MEVKLDKMFLKAKLPIWVFILVAGIGIAIIFLLIQCRDSLFDEMKLQSIEDAYWTKIIPQKDELSSWNTYRNEEYGFEIKYPERWFLYESNLGSTATNNNEPSYQISLTDYNPYVNAGGGEPPKNNIKIDIYIISGTSYSNTEGWVNIIGNKKISNFYIDGRIAIDSEKEETTYSEMYGREIRNYSRNIRVINGNTGYEIYWSPVDSELKGTFNQILSTFKFIP